LLELVVERQLSERRIGYANGHVDEQQQAAAARTADGRLEKRRRRGGLNLG
jgi:hypothetical protein